MEKVLWTPILPSRPRLFSTRVTAARTPDGLRRLSSVALQDRPSSSPLPYSAAPPFPAIGCDADDGEKESPDSLFREKMLFLESYMGMDLFDLTSAHPPIVSASLRDVRSTIDFLESMGFTPLELRRICGMCPEVLTSTPEQLLPVFTFLLREARVQGVNVRHVIQNRPRLLVSDVRKQLRPTLYFLQMLGVTDTAKHATLLSCSVENKLIPRIQYLEAAGFSHKDVRTMVRRFPKLLCYSIVQNVEPKLGFYVMEMGRDLKELKRFPQYFSFSLQDRIIPRHQTCKEKGIFFELPALLTPRDEVFRSKVELHQSNDPL